jgi:serine/threonine-protein phosphatase 5
MIVVESTYDGPKIDSEISKVDKEFVKAMIQRFKDQKKLHKKYAFMVILFFFFDKKVLTVLYD